MDQEETGDEHWGLLTVFGYGLCGAIAGCAIGAAYVLTKGFSGLHQSMFLAPLVGAVAGAIAASGVGKRLARPIRCSYEHLLLSMDVAGIGMVFMGVLGLTEPGSMACVWLALATGTYLLMRRYGYRPGSTALKS